MKRNEQWHRNWNKTLSVCSGFIAAHLHCWYFFTVLLFCHQPCIFMAGKQIPSALGGAHIVFWWCWRSCSATRGGCKTSLMCSAPDPCSGMACTVLGLKILQRQKWNNWVNPARAVGQARISIPRPLLQLLWAQPICTALPLAPEVGSLTASHQKGESLLPSTNLLYHQEKP